MYLCVSHQLPSALTPPFPTHRLPQVRFPCSHRYYAGAKTPFTLPSGFVSFAFRFHPPFSGWGLRVSHVPRCPACTFAVLSDLGRTSAAGLDGFRWRVSVLDPFGCRAGSHFHRDLPTPLRCCPRYSDNEDSCNSHFAAQSHGLCTCCLRFMPRFPDD
jgi:hypothetical protein